MWVWRALIFSLSIALLAAIVAPARALENSPQTPNYTAFALTDFNSEFGSTDSTKISVNNTPSTQAVLSGFVLPEHKRKSNNLADNEEKDASLPSKTPVYYVRFNHIVGLPPFERQAVSAFSYLFQNEPTFVLAYEFLPEILGLKHFLAALITNGAVPWYLRPDAANSHSRLNGWKDGNTLYTGALTYLS